MENFVDELKHRLGNNSRVDLKGLNRIVDSQVNRRNSEVNLFMIFFDDLAAAELAGWREKSVFDGKRLFDKHDTAWKLMHSKLPIK